MMLGLYFGNLLLYLMIIVYAIMGFRAASNHWRLSLTTHLVVAAILAAALSPAIAAYGAHVAILVPFALFPKFYARSLLQLDIAIAIVVVIAFVWIENKRYRTRSQRS